MNSFITVAGLSKCYGRNRALTDLSFQVAQGVTYGLIGPNGAGKTTLMSILAGLVSPTSGKASIMGIEVAPNHPSLASVIGFSTPQLTFFDYLTGAEVLLGFGLMHGLRRADVQVRAHDLIALFDLGPASGQYLHQYSHGMRQKLGLACALVHSPKVLLLDEPFTGLDPASAYRLARTLRQACSNGKTVVLATHDLSMAERLCDRVAILHQGTLKCEMALPPTGREGAADGAGLTSLLWEVVGKPEFTELSWI